MSKDVLDSPSNDAENLDQQTETSSTSDQDLENTDSSSESEKQEPELSTLDLVKGAIEETNNEGESKADSSSEEDKSKEKEESKDESESKEDSEEMTEEEEKAWKEQLNAKTRARFEQLQARYREAKDSLEKAETDAGFKAQFDQFLTNNNMSMEEANTLFDIGALMKSDPRKALEAITPYYNQLLQMTGEVLTPDLQEQVKHGYMTEQAALELSRQRANNRNYETRQQQQFDQQQQQEVQQQNQLQHDIQAALADLEDSWKKSDPDYNMKSTKVQDRVKLMWYEASRNGQMPRTVDQAVRMAEKAKKEVENDLRQFIQKKPVTPVDGGSTGPTKAEPQNTLDVIKQTLGM